MPTFLRADVLFFGSFLNLCVENNRDDPKPSTVVPPTHFAYCEMRCSAVSCTALHCTALHCTALHCTALHCTALHCTALHCTALHCTALHCTAQRPSNNNTLPAPSSLFSLVPLLSFLSLLPGPSLVPPPSSLCQITG